jgi:hypothetical protein
MTPFRINFMHCGRSLCSATLFKKKYENIPVNGGVEEPNHFDAAPGG